jgi:hypothetical protein
MIAISRCERVAKPCAAFTPSSLSPTGSRPPGRRSNGGGCDAGESTDCGACYVEREGVRVRRVSELARKTV